VDFDPPPSASGDVAPELFLEGPSRGDDSDSRHESESRHEVEDEGDTRPKKLRTRGESCVPDERKEAKTLIIPDGVR
jgi:hypothetical protein